MQKLKKKKKKAALYIINAELKRNNGKNRYLNLQTYLRMKCERITIQTSLNSLLSLFFMSKVIKTVVTITIIAKFSISKAITITAKEQNVMSQKYFIWRLLIKIKKLTTYSFKHCDFVQLQGLRGRESFSFGVRLNNNKIK